MKRPFVGAHHGKHFTNTSSMTDSKWNVHIRAGTVCVCVCVCVCGVNNGNEYTHAYYCSKYAYSQADGLLFKNGF